jgi:hypothetical protein
MELGAGVRRAGAGFSLAEIMDDAEGDSWIEINSMLMTEAEFDRLPEYDP